MAQQLQEAQETIAARDAEVAELKSRVAELEALKEQQSQLIQMKDGELAQVQQQLKVQNESRTDAGSGQALLWSAFAVLLLAGIVFAVWMLRQRKQSAWEAAVKRGAGASVAVPVDNHSLADEPATAFEPDKADTDDAAITPELPLTGGETAAWDEFQDGGEKTAETRSPDTANTLWHLPSWVGSASHEWEASGGAKDNNVALKPLTDDPAKVGAWTFPVDGGEPRAEGFASQAQPVLPDAVPAVPERSDAAVAEAGASLTGAPPEDGRLMLARTYIELGDHGTARLLLQQVLDEGEAAQAQQARQLLESLD